MAKSIIFQGFGDNLVVLSQNGNHLRDCAASETPFPAFDLYSANWDEGLRVLPVYDADNKTFAFAVALLGANGKLPSWPHMVQTAQTQASTMLIIDCPDDVVIEWMADPA